MTDENNSGDSAAFYLKDLPAEVRWLAESVWGRLPEARQKQLVELIPILPKDSTAGLKKLYELGEDHLRMAFGQRHQVAIVGPANVGKSTLFNQMIRSGEKTAAVSPVPGTTTVNQLGSGGLFNIVDTPGADAVGSRGDREREMALEAAGSADFLVILFDAIQGIKSTEQALFNHLKGLGKPYLVGLNKIDLLKKRDRDAVLYTAAHNLGLQPNEVIPLSALKAEGVPRLLLTIAKTEPALLAALGEALPAYRGRLAWQATLRAASSAAIVALTPIPIVDFLPLVTIQTLLVLAIGRIYQYKLTPARAAELMGTMGLGYLGRALFYELTKLGGPPAWIVSVAIAAAMTVLVGYSAMMWFEKGEKITAAQGRHLLKLLTQQIIKRLNPFGRRRPGKEALSDTLQESLEAEEIAQEFIKE